MQGQQHGRSRRGRSSRRFSGWATSIPTSVGTTAQNLRRQLLLGFRDLGYLEDRNFQMEDRNAEGNLERLPALAADLARLPVDIIVAIGEAPIRAAMQATDKIPIVMTISADPIGSGLVASLNRPGGNVTGMSNLAPEMAGKRVELLKEVIPRASRVAVLWNSNNKSKFEEWNDTQTAAKTTGLTVISVKARTAEEIERAFGSILRERPDAVITLAESLTLAYRKQIGHFAVSNRLPIIAELREFTVPMVLPAMVPAVPICGGAPRDTSTRSCAAPNQAICRSSNPSDRDGDQSQNREGDWLDVPPTLLARADEVIE